ncbi:MAG: alpha/beta hydrolase, partial [Steroidobacteraceae bacterium]
SRDMGQCYVVGIGYRKNSAPEAAAIRCRDLTPARSPKFEEAFPKVMAMFGGQAPVTTGGGPQFLRFLVEELKLYIEAHFPVDPHDSTLAGLSFGGLFATYTLLNEPSAFQRYIICSPSLLYENEHIFAHEAAYAAQHRDLDARVFLTCGALESESESLAAIEKMPPAVKASLIQLWRPRMVELLEPFAERLRQRAYPSLKLTSHVFPGEHHNSVYPSAISRGLRVVFAK